MKPTKHINITQSIIKAMGMFGGVQAMNILCSILRVKLVAIWIGPAGIGLFGLYSSAMEMITSITGLGLRQSSVRDIAGQNYNASKLHIIATVVKRWSWIVGIFGAFITLAFAGLLSKWTFGDDTHIWGFVILSITLLFNALTNGEQAILQGSNKLKRLASASVYGAWGGLLISVPLFYFYGLDSIVYSILAYSVVTFLFTYIFRNKEIEKPSSLSVQDTLKMGGGFIQLGILMTISSFVALLCSYIFIAYLNHIENTETVGFYQAGYTLITKYSGLILTAIGMEYYPRLAKVCKHNNRTSIFVSQEINLVLLILTPIIVSFLLFRTWIVEILYAPEFIHAVIPFITWGIVGTIFRAVAWSIGIVMIARGAGKIFIVTETIDAIIGIILNIIFYHYFGWVGLGISFILWYVIYTFIVGFVYLRKFKLQMKNCVWKSIGYSISTSSIALLCVYHEWTIGVIFMLLLTLFFSMKNLRKMLKLR